LVNLIWDLDGTLIDSMPIITKCLNKTAVYYGKPEWPLDKLKPLIGPELEIILATVLSLENNSDVKRAKEKYREYYQVEMLNSPLFNGILEALKAFSDIGFKHFIATAKYQKYAKLIIESTAAGDQFSAVYGTTENGDLGDKKDLLKKLIEEENIKPAQTIMIGDTRYDIAAGRANNLTSVGVLWGYGEQSTLKEEGAHYFVEAPEQLVSVIREALTCSC